MCKELKDSLIVNEQEFLVLNEAEMICWPLIALTQQIHRKKMPFVAETWDIINV